MTQIDGTGAAGGPPDRWLRVFDAAARTGSFTAAARTLGVGQPAVSHAVARLERWLDAVLFERSRSGVVLTEAGRVLADEVGAAFGRLDRVVAAVRARVHENRRVTLAVSTSLAAHWLMPRLAEFKAAHPDVELRCITRDDDASVGRGDADLWIPLGAGPWPGMSTWHFCDEEVFPVASPEVAEAIGPVRGSVALLGAPLLHLEESYRSRFDWHRWFAETGVPAPERLPGERSNDYSLILHAAMAGQGVALGWRHNVGSLVAQGRLVPVGDRRVATGEPFVIVATDDDPGPATTTLRRWLVAAMADDRVMSVER